MPAIAAIVLADATPVTPVNHTFDPQTTDGSNAKLANRAATIPQGFETLQLEVRAPSSATGAYRLLWKMSFPVVAAVSGVDTVVSTNTCDFTINFSQSSTAQKRKDIAKILSNLFNHATFVSMCEKVEPIY